MPRRKKNVIEEATESNNTSDDLDLSNVKKLKKKKFVYCDTRKCPHVECLRHHVNTPFNVKIWMDKFYPDKDWNCKYYITEVSDEYQMRVPDEE